MGGCATKPKAFKSRETTEAPPPAPKPVKEDKSVGISLALEPKDKEVLVSDAPEKKEGNKDKPKKVDDDAKSDEQIKHMSLNNLMENEQSNDSTDDEKTPPELVKDSTENEKTLPEPVKDSTKTDTGSSEPVKVEEVVEPEKPKHESATKVPEAKASKTQVEQTSAQEFVDDPKEPLPAKVIEAVPAVDTQSGAAKSIEEVKENVEVIAKPVSEEKTTSELKENSAENVKPGEKTLELKENSAENVKPVERTLELKENSAENMIPVEKTLELKENSAENMIPVERTLELKENSAENPKQAVLEGKTFESKGNSVENVKQVVSEKKIKELNENSGENAKPVTEEKNIELK